MLSIKSIKNNLKEFKYILLCIYRYNNKAVYSCAIPYNKEFQLVNKQRLISENLILYEKIYTVEKFFKILEYTISKNLLTLQYPLKVFQETKSFEEYLLFPIYRFKYGHCKQNESIEDKVIEIIGKNNNALNYYKLTKNNLYSFELLQLPSFLEKEEYFKRKKVKESCRHHYELIFSRNIKEEYFLPNKIFVTYKNKSNVIGRYLLDIKNNKITLPKVDNISSIKMQIININNEIVFYHNLYFIEQIQIDITSQNNTYIYDKLSNNIQNSSLLTKTTNYKHSFLTSINSNIDNNTVNEYQASYLFSPHIEGVEKQVDCINKIINGNEVIIIDPFFDENTISVLNRLVLSHNLVFITSDSKINKTFLEKECIYVNDKNTKVILYNEKKLHDRFLYIKNKNLLYLMGGSLNGITKNANRETSLCMSQVYGDAQNIILNNIEKIINNCSEDKTITISNNKKENENIFTKNQCYKKIKEQYFKNINSTERNIVAICKILQNINKEDYGSLFYTLYIIYEIKTQEKYSLDTENKIKKSLQHIDVLKFLQHIDNKFTFKLTSSTNIKCSIKDEYSHENIESACNPIDIRIDIKYKTIIQLLFKISPNSYNKFLQTLDENKNNHYILIILSQFSYISAEDLLKSQHKYMILHAILNPCFISFQNTKNKNIFNDKVELLKNYLTQEELCLMLCLVYIRCNFYTTSAKELLSYINTEILNKQNLDLIIKSTNLYINGIEKLLDIIFNSNKTTTKTKFIQQILNSLSTHLYKKYLSSDTKYAYTSDDFIKWYAIVLINRVRLNCNNIKDTLK